MSINLPYVERTIEKLRHILKSHKIRPTFCTDRLCVNSYLNREIEQLQKINIVYGIDCSNSEAVYFGESKRSLRSRSDEHKRSGRNYDCENYEMAKHCWEADQNFSQRQKKVVDMESWLILWKPYIL